MTRVEYDDGTVVWRRSLFAKVVWGVGVGAYTIAVLVSGDLDLGRRVLLLAIAGLTAGLAWARVWRPHLAATADGIVVRRVRSAVLVPWQNVAGVTFDGIWGVVVRVRVGEHVESAVPRRSAVQWFLGLDSEADRAARLIEERARVHMESL